MKMKKNCLCPGYSGIRQRVKFYALGVCCLSAVCLASCSDDDEEGGAGGQGNVANEMPTVSNAGIEHPVASIYHGYNAVSSNMIYAFSYRDGRMTSALEYNDYYAPLTFYSGPLSAKWVGEDETVEYKNIHVNSAGFITSCDIVYTEVYEEEVYTEEYNVTLAYDSEGHAVSENFRYTDSDGEGGQGTVTYTWENGNLVNVSSTEVWNYGGEEDSWRYEEEYIYDEDLYPNPGVWNFYEVTATGPGYCFDNAEAFLYAGLLGRPTENIPIGYKESQYDDDTFYTYTTESVSYNEDGSVRNISSGYVSTYHGSTSNYRSGIHIDYDYDTNWNDNYETLTQNYYAVGRSNVDKPARKMSVLRKNNEKKSRGNENPKTVK